MIRRLFRGVVRSAAGRVGLRVMKYPQASFSSYSPLDLAMVALSKTPEANKHFILVGANDGVYGDHLHKYTDSGLWQGILVEPQPDVFERLKFNLASRPNLTFENLAIGQGKDAVRLYCAPKARRDAEAHASTVTSFDPKIVAHQLKIPIGELEYIDVPCLSLTNLIEKHGCSDTSVLLIDCEGADYDVLTSLDFKRYSPLVIQFEHGHLNPKQITAAVDLLSANGYRVNYGGFQHDTVAIHEVKWREQIGPI